MVAALVGQLVLMVCWLADGMVVSKVARMDEKMVASWVAS